MKNNYRLITAGVLASCIFATSSLAQNCAVPPSCEDLGYIRSEYDCDGFLSVKCPFDKTKVFCSKVKETAKPGNIVYSDGSWNSSVLKGKTPVGVIAFISGNYAYAVSLPSVTKAWANSYSDTAVPNGTGSSCSDEDTSYLGSNSNYPAANYCKTLGAAGQGMGEWYLPTDLEMRKIFENINIVNSGLSKVGSTISQQYHWTACEADSSRAYHSYNTSTDPYNKTSSRPTRCIRPLYID